MSRQMHLVGVYTLPVSKELVATQTEILHGDQPSDEDRQQVREQLESTVLVEVLVSEADEDFHISDFTQEDPATPRENWQAAWAEAFLSKDGEQLLCDRRDSLPAGEKSLRIAFFMHNWKVGNSLLTSYGTLATARPIPMPQRLQRLVPYECVD